MVNGPLIRGLEEPGSELCDECRKDSPARPGVVGPEKQEEQRKRGQRRHPGPDLVGLYVKTLGNYWAL